MSTAIKTIKRKVRQARIRAKISGTSEVPRLSVFKSNKFIYAQLIDDKKGTTLVASSGKEIKAKTKTEQAMRVGEDIAKKAEGKKITMIVLDRSGYIYTGRVTALAEAAREAGLKF